MVRIWCGVLAKKLASVEKKNTISSAGFGLVSADTLPADAETQPADTDTFAASSSGRDVRRFFDGGVVSGSLCLKNHTAEMTQYPSTVRWIVGL